MLLIDVPVGIVAGQVIADASRDAIAARDGTAVSRARAIAIIFAYLATTPVIVYFFLGWPAWEMNYFWKWVDNVQGTPELALSSFMLIAMSFFPTLAGFESGRLLVQGNRVPLLRASYTFFFLLILVIVWMTRDITFNVATTYDKYTRGEFFSFWDNPFFTYWLVLTALFWGSLAGCYVYVRKSTAV
ncbi:MAG: hypothetical protein GXO94_01370 [Nitrospirae bacterium]|nr:hypothetical protein [Nitrospirota bacterium]